MRRTYGLAIVLSTALAIVLAGCGGTSKRTVRGAARGHARPCGKRSTACHVIVAEQDGTIRTVWVESGAGLPPVQAPLEVQRSGGRRLAEFNSGRDVAARLAARRVTGSARPATPDPARS